MAAIVSMVFAKLVGLVGYFVQISDWVPGIAHCLGLGVGLIVGVFVSVKLCCPTRLQAREVLMTEKGMANEN